MPKKPSRRSSSIGRKHKKGAKDKAKAAARDAAASSARAAMAAVKKQQNKIVDKVQKALMCAGIPLACVSTPPGRPRRTTAMATPAPTPPGPRNATHVSRSR